MNARPARPAEGGVQKRLQACMKRGNLRVADLARWFDRPHPTVRGWALKGIQPGGGPHDVEQVHDQLVVLERLVEARKGFPVPRLSPRNRKQHILDIRTRVF